MTAKRSSNAQKNGALGTWFKISTPHNPEVVGSSPASATIKNTGFRKKSGVFLTFRNKTEASKIGVELALELVAENAKIENRENPTFLGKLGFSY